MTELKDRIIIKRPVVTEDEYGELTVTEDNVVVECWAGIKEIKPDLQTQSGAILQTRRLEITADSRDTVAVDLGDIVTVNNLNNSNFVVTNQWESDWRRYRTIIAEYTDK